MLDPILPLKNPVITPEVFPVFGWYVFGWQKSYQTSVSVGVWMSTWMSQEVRING